VPVSGVDAAADVDRNHMVHLYERDADLCGEAARYIADAVAAGDGAIVIATEDHRESCWAELTLLGVDGDQELRHGRILAFDPITLLDRFAAGGQIDAASFRSTIGGILRAAEKDGHRVRVFGEMVSVLWEAGHVMAALELEELWNELQQTSCFSLLCAYDADAVSSSDHADALGRVCGSHTSVLAGRTSRDGDGHMLPGAIVSARYPAQIDAPRAARHLVVNEMRRWGFGAELLDDAALVVTELAANAVVHARSAFSVVLQTEREVLRISVEDSLPIDRERLVVRSGRGIGLVARLAQRWGMHVSGDGKVIWAELAST
jgi:anti-sigma regulatory factor (Ser/Thr protein kinase)